MEVVSSRFVQADDPWGCIRIHSHSVNRFIDEFKAAVESVPDGDYYPSCFIHETNAYTLPKGAEDVVVKKEITPIGLVFLQGDLEKTKEFLKEYGNKYFLVKDRTTGATARIPARQMNLFKKVLEVEPERITCLDNPISSFRSRKRIRILSGILKGQTGYLVRYRRDRKLVVGLAGLTIAYGGIHNDTFEFLE